MSGLISIGNKVDGNITVFEVDEVVDDTIEIHDENAVTVPTTVIETYAKTFTFSEPKIHKKISPYEKYIKIFNITKLVEFAEVKTVEKPVVKHTPKQKKKKEADFSFFDTDRAPVKIYDEPEEPELDEVEEVEEFELDKYVKHDSTSSNPTSVSSTSSSSSSANSSSNPLSPTKPKPKKVKLSLAFQIKPIVSIYKPDVLFELYAGLLIDRFDLIVKCANDPAFKIDIPHFEGAFPRQLNIVHTPIYPISICRNNDCYGKCNFYHPDKNQCGVHNFDAPNPIRSTERCVNDLCVALMNNGCTRTHKFSTVCMSMIIRGVMFHQSPDPERHVFDKKILYTMLKNIGNIRIGKEPLKNRINALP